jgi:hypothetical protein
MERRSKGHASKSRAAGDEPERLSRAEIERRVLAVLWAASQRQRRRTTARTVLHGYRWEDPAHQIIFELIMRLGSAQSAAVRRELPALLTRHGFPDFDFPELATKVSAPTAEAWIRRLARFAGSGSVSP